MLSFHIFIISWVGQHEKAIQIANDLSDQHTNISIVYSDPDPELVLNTQFNQIRRPNHLFWADKFQSCLNACEKDLLVVIHADCHCENWCLLVQKMLAVVQKNPRIWVYSPLIEGASYHLGITKIASIQNSLMDIVSDTDGIIFCLTRKVQDRMRRVDYTKNTLGWGISAMFCAFTFASGMLAVVDKSNRAFHPSHRGYDSTDAWRQRMEFLEQLEGFERIQAILLKNHFILLKNQVNSG